MQVVEKAAPDREVRTVHLQVGQLRQVIPDTLRYCWGIVTEGTSLANSVLDIESIPVVGSCRECGAETTVEHALVLVCSGCGKSSLEIVRGEEFLITTLDLAERATT